MLTLEKSFLRVVWGTAEVEYIVRAARGEERVCKVEAVELVEGDGAAGMASTLIGGGWRKDLRKTEEE